MRSSAELNRLIADCLASGRYEATADGHVDKHRWNNTTTTRRCRERVNPHGYARVTMKRECERGHEVMVHRVVAFAFIGPPPTADHEINHINGNKLDNRPSNLEWTKRPENLSHAWRAGLRSVSGPIGRSGENHHKAKLSEPDVRSMHRLRSTTTQAELARRFGVSQSAVSMVLSGKNWPHIYREFHP